MQTSYKIIEHSKTLPHKQYFQVVLEDRISHADLDSLTEDISQQHRVADERMYFHWWLASQDISREMCWAHSLFDGVAHSGTNLLSLEEFLESVEVRPLKEDDELGLWFWDIGSTSNFIHIRRNSEGVFRLYRSFLDGSSADSTLELVCENPLRLKWAEDEYLELRDGELAIWDDQGQAVPLTKIR